MVWPVEFFNEREYYTATPDGLDRSAAFLTLEEMPLVPRGLEPLQSDVCP